MPISYIPRYLAYPSSLDNWRNFECKVSTEIWDSYTLYLNPFKPLYLGPKAKQRSQKWDQTYPGPHIAIMFVDAFSLQSTIPFVFIDRSKIETFCNGMVRWRLKAKQKSNSKNLQKRRQNFQPQTTCKLCWWHAFRKKMIVSKAKKPHLKKVSVKSSYNAHCTFYSLGVSFWLYKKIHYLSFI